MRYWGWGLLVVFRGPRLHAGPVPAGAGRADFAGNALIAISPAFAIQGVLHYAGRRLARSAVIGGIAVTLAVLAIGNFATPAPHAAVNVVAPTVLATAFFAWGAAMLLLHPPADADRAARFLALVLLAAVARLVDAGSRRCPRFWPSPSIASRSTW